MRVRARSRVCRTDGTVSGAKHHTLTPYLTPINMSPVTFISLVKDAAAGADR